jgi:tRNA modification GTPase
MTQQTIAAIATPIGPGGIGIIRISGPDACPILKRLFVRNNSGREERLDSSTEADFSSHVFYYGSVLDFSLQKVIDEVLVVYMKAPKSFTREDVVEIHSHSGYVVLDRILRAVIDSGAVLAEPGEFTKRAFLNGRIDLTQAEAVIDLINAPCETAAMMASRQIAGGMKQIVENLLETVLNFQAQCEASLEFSDEINRPFTYSDFQKRIQHSILPDIRSLIAKHKEMAVFKEGLHLAIGGLPNVGKSSLLNQLVDRETAIVSDLPGTTRDIVREYISMSGVPLVIYDTAGIHHSNDPVECMGIERAKGQIDRSDLVLWVMDGSRHPSEDEKRMVEETRQDKTIVVINKKDVAKEETMSAIEATFADHTCIRLSAKIGTNIEKLKQTIFEKIMIPGRSVSGDQVSPNVRQRNLLEKVIEEINPLASTETPEISPDLVSEKLNRVKHLLEQISGKENQEDLYDAVFSQFCIGK